MAGSTFGKLFCITTFGESHGPVVGCIVDGCPSGLALAKEDIQSELDKRRPGASSFTSQRREKDQVNILSGVFEGITTGAPITLLIENTQHKSSDYESIKRLFRPGHGDYTYFKKYGHRDYRGGGRASARETAARVAGGAIAKIFLANKGIKIRGYLAQMGDIAIEPAQFSWDEVACNPFFCPDKGAVPKMEALIDTLRREGDSIGAKVCVEASGVPVGLGEPVFDKLDADITKALMSINAVKGVSVGDGFDVVSQKGSEHRDEITPEGFLSNHAGGIVAGISTGQVIRASLALKPSSSIRVPGRTIDIDSQPATVVTKGRHDPCVGIRAVPVVESMLALVVMDHWLQYFGQGRCV